MVKWTNKVMALALAASMILGFTACSNEGSPQSVDKALQEEMVYVPEYVKVEHQEEGSLILDKVLPYKGNILFTGGYQNEEAGNYSGGLYMIPAGTAAPKRLPFPGEENSAIINFTVDMDGNPLLFIQSYDLPEGETQEMDALEVKSSLRLVRMDPDGKELDSVLLDGVFENPSDYYVTDMETDAEGNVYLTTGQDLYVVNKEGSLLFHTPLSSWVMAMGRMGDGTALVSSFGVGQLEIKPVETKSQALGEPFPEAVPAGRGGNIVIGRDAAAELLYSVESKVYAYEPEKAAPNELFDWMDVDINSNEVKCFSRLEDGRLMAFLEENTGSGKQCEIVYLKQSKASDVAEKQTLTLATLSLSTGLKRRIIDFNKSSSEYRVEVREYAGADIGEAIVKLNNDIVSGKCPDIVDLSQGLSMRQYASKGILEDLNPYLDGDEELKREDYLENVLSSYEIDGKLFGISSRFAVATVLAKTSEMKGRKSWTLDEMMEYIDGKPEGTEVLEYVTSHAMLQLNLAMNLGRYVDWNTGECSFDSEEFQKLLQFCSKFPLPGEIPDNLEDENLHDKIQNGRVLLASLELNSPEIYQVYEQVFGEPVTFIGYPSQDGNGSYFQPLEMLGMSAASKHKDAVWQFLRLGMTKEYQDPANEVNSGAVETYGFPIMKSSLDYQLEQAMEPSYYEDANGNQIERSKMSYGMGGGSNPFIVQIYASKQEEVDAVRDLIESTTAGYDFDDQLFAIIQEEAEAYFQGQKSVSEVAGMIQNRAKIYIEEGR